MKFLIWKRAGENERSHSLRDSLNVIKNYIWH
nr:MAG TPA: histidine kinase-like protein [Crassvirales sp.]